MGDWVIVHLNKARIQKGVPSKLQMRRIGPCQILAKYGSNVYKVDLPKDITLSPIFNVADLIKYMGPPTKAGKGDSDVAEMVTDLTLPSPPKPKEKKVLDSRVVKKTRHGNYMEHLIKWTNMPEA